MLCKKKCPVCNENIESAKIISHSLLSIEQKSFTCGKCNSQIKADIGTATMVAAMPPVFIVPFMTNSDFSIYEILIWFPVLFLVIILLFVCLTSLVELDK